MNAYENLTSRRSTKSFTDQKVDKETIEKIVYAGQCAPTGMNRQPCAFVVIQDEETIKEIGALNAAAMNSTMDPFYGAHTVIIVFANTNSGTYLYDGSLAMGNLLNAANSLGVGAAWIHRAKNVFQSQRGKEFMKKWGLSDEYEGIGNCILGYGPMNSNEKPITSKVVWD